MRPSAPGSGEPSPTPVSLSRPLPVQFKRLQGKRNRGREEINFVEIKGDDQLSGVQQWLTKSLTEEQSMKSFSKVCRAAPSPVGAPEKQEGVGAFLGQGP